MIHASELRLDVVAAVVVPTAAAVLLLLVLSGGAWHRLRRVARTPVVLVIPDCAMNLALRHPRTYALAVSRSGYDRTPDDVVTGEQFADRPDLAAADDAVALLRERPAPLAMLVTAGTDEPDERAAAAPPVTVDTRAYPGGGHNRNAVRAQLPDLVDRLGSHLLGPLVPPAPPAGVTVDDGPGVPQRVLPVPDP